MDCPEVQYDFAAPMIAAFFDIEGTLYTAPMGRGFVEYAKDHRRRHRVFRYYLSIMPRYYLYKLGLVPLETVHRPAIANMAGLIEGYDQVQANRAFDWISFDFIVPSGREEVLARWREHQAQGHLLVIVSGGLEPCVERIRNHLGAHEILCTSLEVQDGRYTGQVLPPVMIGDEKGKGCRQLINRLGIDLEWEKSFAYADSIHDLSMLELVGNPVVVHPNQGLRDHASEHQWEIIG
jgi:HAD superfamily hydrolase (TIGR01490 family)